MGAKTLTYDERYQLFELNLAGMTVLAMSNAMRRTRSCLYDEFNRGGGRTNYCPDVAQLARKAASQTSANNHPMKPQKLVKSVGKLLARNWSPQQISGRKSLLGESSFSTSGIYRLVSRLGWTAQLRRYKPRGLLGRPASRPYCGTAMPISKRPKEVFDRITKGHWESDTMLCKRQDSMRLLVSVERQSQYVVCRLMPCVTATDTAKWINKDIVKSGLPFHTLTTDRGGEFASLGKTLAGKAYVCDPNCPNQRGTNENIIGLLRQYAPKGKSLSKLTQADVKKMQDKLNERPRKTLGYYTPNEIMFNRLPTIRS